MHGGVSSAATDEDIVISGNVIKNTDKNGINILNHNNVKIYSNSNITNIADKGIFISSSSPGAVNISIENNTIKNTQEEGIYVYSAMQVVVISNK